MVVEIELSKTGKKYKGVYKAIVDDCDGDLLDFAWSALVLPKSKTLYAKRSGWNPRREILLHVVIFERTGRNLKKGEEVDHIDGNGLNNQRSNLRAATRLQNRANVGMHSNNKSGYKGVMRIKSRWMARITLNKKQIYLGTFDTPEEAHEAYCKKAEELYGEFARG